jgi:hypothetical protein
MIRPTYWVDRDEKAICLTDRSNFLHPDPVFLHARLPVRTQQRHKNYQALEAIFSSGSGGQLL